MLQREQFARIPGLEPCEPCAVLGQITFLFLYIVAIGAFYKSMIASDLRHAIGSPSIVALHLLLEGVRSGFCDFERGSMGEGVNGTGCEHRKAVWG